jgi:hypothetical protein
MASPLPLHKSTKKVLFLQLQLCLREEGSGQVRDEAEEDMQVTQQQHQKGKARPSTVPKTSTKIPEVEVRHRHLY